MVQMGVSQRCSEKEVIVDAVVVMVFGANSVRDLMRHWALNRTATGDSPIQMPVLFMRCPVNTLASTYGSAYSTTRFL